MVFSSGDSASPPGAGFPAPAGPGKVILRPNSTLPSATNLTSQIRSCAVVAKMREMPINDFFAKNGKIREDGRMVHDMYLMQVKAPAESKGEWDLFKLVETIPGDRAFRPLDAGGCPLVAKVQ